jgi:hypothetical protein
MVTTELFVNNIMKQPEQIFLMVIPSPLPSVTTEEMKATECEDDVPSLMPQEEEDDIDNEAEEEEDDVAEHPELPQQTRRSARIVQGLKPPERYILATKIEETVKQLDKQSLEEAKWKAYQAEILQIFVELKALMPVVHEDIPEDADILRSFIFLVKKFLVSGEFDKVKARMVANGAQQSRELYPNHSSPTVGIHSTVTCLTMAAQRHDFILSKVYVKGAYLQTEMMG